MDQALLNAVVTQTNSIYGTAPHTYLPLYPYKTDPGYINMEMEMPSSLMNAYLLLYSKSIVKEDKHNFTWSEFAIWRMIFIC